MRTHAYTHGGRSVNKRLVREDPEAVNPPHTLHEVQLSNLVLLVRATYAVIIA